MKVALVGATRGMGRAVARVLAARGDSLVLLGRDPLELDRAVRDLALRGAASASSAELDLARPYTFASGLERAESALDGLDAVIVTGGLFATQDELEADPERLAALLAVDFSHTVLFCEEARRRLLARGGGTLCVFSSVAGDRARTPVVLYGAAKAGLSHYLEGLDHRFRRKGLRTVTVKPGFVSTGMTDGLPQPPFAGEPESVALRVVRALDRGSPVVYAPPIWRLVMLAIGFLPRALMRRLAF